MNEHRLEEILIREVSKIGGRAYKWVSPGNSGVPDRIVLFPGGKICFVELKTESGKLSAQQKIQINRLHHLGQDAVVVRGIDGLAWFFRRAGYNGAAGRLEKRYGIPPA